MKNFLAQSKTALFVSFFLTNQLAVTDKVRLKTAYLLMLFFANIGTLIVYTQLIFVNVGALRSGELTVIGTGNHERALITNMLIEMVSRIIQSTIFIVILTLFFAFLFKLFSMKKLSFRDAQVLSCVNTIVASILTTFIPFWGMPEGILIIVIGLIVRSILVHRSHYMSANATPLSL